MPIKCLRLRSVIEGFRLLDTPRFISLGTMRHKKMELEMQSQSQQMQRCDEAQGPRVEITVPREPVFPVARPEWGDAITFERVFASSIGDVHDIGKRPFVVVELTNHSFPLY
jgi:hypothetical protein